MPATASLETPISLEIPHLNPPLISSPLLSLTLFSSLPLSSPLISSPLLIHTCAGKMGNSSSMVSKDPNRYLPVPREQYLRLGLASPPENGYDDFLKLVWCRDIKYEKQQQKKAEKEGKKDAVIEKKYYLCIVGTYEPYGRNVPPINLNKHGYKALPKWNDPEHQEEILRNGYFFQNDDFVLENYPQAIKPAEDYPYAEQYVKAYKHHNQQHQPTRDQIERHGVDVGVSIMEEIAKLESDTGEKNTETLQKLKDILESMDLDRDLRQECVDRVAAKKRGNGNGVGAGGDSSKS
jgi:hypothetical protein